MDSQTLSQTSRQIEALLDGGEKNRLTGLRQESLLPGGSGPPVIVSAQTLKIAVVQGLHQSAIVYGDIIHGDINSLNVFVMSGCKPLLIDLDIGGVVGSYSEKMLYGAVGSPAARFRSAIQALKSRAELTASLSPDEVEYGHQAALVWAEVGRLKEFIGTSPVVSEIVAELRTARFQFLGKDTPTTAMQAVAMALGLVAQAKRLDASLVDRIVEALEEGEIDSLAPDALRVFHG